MNGPTILNGLHNSICSSFRCVRIFQDAAKICMDKHTRISEFFHFGPHKTYSRITVSTFTIILDQEATPTSPDKKYAQRTCLPHLELFRPSRIVGPFICWIFFCKFQSIPLIKFKFYDGRQLPLKRAFNWYKAIPTHLNSRETLHLTNGIKPSHFFKKIHVLLQKGQQNYLNSLSLYFVFQCKIWYLHFIWYRTST